jgi:hypothetical protein
LRGAIAVLLAGPDAKPAPLMPMVPWELAVPQTGISGVKEP